MTVEIDRDTYRLAIREAIEIVLSEPLLRMRDEDGVEWVGRDGLIVALRARAHRRTRSAAGEGGPS